MLPRIPSREVSYDMLLEANRQFQSESESLEDKAVNAVMIERNGLYQNALHGRTKFDS